MPNKAMLGRLLEKNVCEQLFLFSRNKYMLCGIEINTDPLFIGNITVIYSNII